MGNSQESIEHSGSEQSAFRPIRIPALILLLLFEVSLIAFLYEPAHSGTISLYALNKFVFYGKLQPFVLLLICIFPIFLWARQRELASMWLSAIKQYSWLRPLALNFLLFVLLLPLTVYLNRGSGSGNVYILLNVLWHIGLVVLLTTLFLAVAPFSFWWRFIRTFYLGIILAVVASAFIVGIAVLSQSTWNSLSEATFAFSYGILSLYESDIFVNAATKELSVNGFLIRIAPECSGYEGIGLILTFLTIYIIAFRQSLKFPNVFLLYAIGIPLIWVLNAVRIAFLASIGGHISPEIAVTGFHSQAGWIMFLTVTLLLMFVSSRLSFFNKIATKTNDQDPAVRLAIALLAPFIAFMAASIVTSTFATKVTGEWLYSIKVIAILIVLWIYRDVYIRLVDRVSLLSIMAGILIGIIWILTDNNVDRQNELSEWIKSLSGGAFALWITIRCLGTVILVPIAEELAFRSYLHRALVARRFETVDHSTFSWLAFGATTILFAGMHSGRFVEALFAGAIFALMMYRTNRISDAIAAHMSANAVIAVWAVWGEQWSLF